MRSTAPVRKLVLFALLLGTFVFVQPSKAQRTAPPMPSGSGLPTETPAKFTVATSTWDYIRRDVMIPMRDGVKLHTVILIPKGAHNAPILLTRTPYSAAENTSFAASSHLRAVLAGGDSNFGFLRKDGYIRVFQDVRGKYGSQGNYVMNPYVHGALNPTPIDEATDTYDTIAWLVKNIPETNGNVGVIGTSYDGFEALMALIHPNPHLKVVIAENPMVDGWRGDDWFHNGAFREQMMPYIYVQEATRKVTDEWWTSHFDDYDAYLRAVSAGNYGRIHGMEQLGFWRKILANPSYDAFWSDQAVDKILASQPLIVPVMLVDSLWDQEDIYGATAVYRAIKPKDTDNTKVFLVMGPWFHGEESGRNPGSHIGAIPFGSETAHYYHEKILRPFLAQYLIGGAPNADTAPVTAFVTGADTWERLPAWPAGCGSGCTLQRTPLYLRSNHTLSFTAPNGNSKPFNEYISDPNKPVPYRIRPVPPIYGKYSSWHRWLVDDQREFSTRSDVLVYETDTLKRPVKISGRPVVHLVASTSGTDSDWVVKLIDVYPDEVGGEPKLGGYQLMVSADIFRGRYRQSFENPAPITPNRPLLYQFQLPTANHVFRPGHDIMVQVQSSWFPLYDRNPQTFVPNIFWAKPEDYKKAVQRVYTEPGEASFIELPLVTMP